MKYLIKLNKLQEKNEVLKCEFKKIDDIIDKYELVKKNTTWTGEGSNSFFNEYDNYCNEIKKIENQLIATIDYFNKYYDSYDEEFEKIKNKFVLEEVDKND